MPRSPTSPALRRLVASARSSLKRLPASSQNATYTAMVPNYLVSHDGPARLRADAPRQGSSSSAIAWPTAAVATAGSSALAAGPQHAETSSTPHQLPNDLLLHILRLLPSQQLACDGRRVCCAAASYFNTPADRNVSLSLPMAPHIAERWQEGARPGLKQLTMWRRLALLSTAAATGCEANLDAAWALVSPGLALDLRCNQSVYSLVYGSGLDPGPAAASAGHLDLLPWLVQHGLPLDPEATLVAAAPHGDLAALQRTLLLLHSRLNSSMFAYTHMQLLCAVARGGGPHATAKLAWLLPRWRDEMSRADALWDVSLEACNAPDPVPLLQWVRERGLDLRQAPLVAEAMARSSLEVVEWLVREAGCPLLAPILPEEEGFFGAGEEGSAASALKLAFRAAGSGSVEKVRWVVLQQGVVLQQLRQPGLVLAVAAELGHAHMVRYLHEECGLELQPDVADAAVESGHVELAAWLLSKGCPPSGPQAYGIACRSGDMPMLLWLLHGASCPVGRLSAEEVVWWWPRHGEDRPGQLMNAVQAVLEGGWPMGNGSAVFRVTLRRGDLALARALHQEHGMELGAWALYEAAGSGCEALLEWVAAVADSGWGEGRLELHQYQPEWDPYPVGAAYDDLASMRCLRRLGVPVGAETLCQAVGRHASLAALGVLVEWGAASSRQDVGRALEVAGRARRSREVLVWLRGLMRGLPLADGDRRGKGLGGSGAAGSGGGGWQQGEEAGTGGCWGPLGRLGKGSCCGGCM